MKGELRLTGYKHHQRVFFHFYDCLPFYFCKNSITKRTGVLSFSRFISSWKKLYMADSFQMKHLSRLSQNNIKVRTQLAFVITGKSPSMGFFFCWNTNSTLCDNLSGRKKCNRPLLSKSPHLQTFLLFLYESSL